MVRVIGSAVLLQSRQNIQRHKIWIYLYISPALLRQQVSALGVGAPSHLSVVVDRIDTQRLAAAVPRYRLYRCLAVQTVEVIDVYLAESLHYAQRQGLQDSLQNLRQSQCLTVLVIKIVAPYHKGIKPHGCRIGSPLLRAYQAFVYARVVYSRAINAVLRDVTQCLIIGQVIVQPVQHTEIAESQTYLIILQFFVGLLVKLRVQASAPIQAAVSVHIQPYAPDLYTVQVFIGAITRARYLQCCNAATYNYCAERWTTNFDVHQTITDLPAGKYVLSCQGFYRAGGTGDVVANQGKQNAVIYANEATAPVMSILDDAGKVGSVQIDGYGVIPNWMNEAANAFNEGLYSDNHVEAVVKNGTLTIGIKKDVTISQDWCIFDSFRLTYYGLTRDLVVEILQSNINEADGLIKSLTLISTLCEPLQAVITEANDAIADPACSTDSLNSLNDKLVAEKDILSPYLTPYNDIVTLINSCETTLANSKASHEVRAEFEKAIANAKAKLAEATSAQEIEALHEPLMEANNNYMAEAIPTDGGYFDVTFKLSNPTCTENYGWEKHIKNASASYNVNNSSLNSSEYAGVGIEVWQSSHDVFDGADLIWQTLTDLPQGVYEISALVTGNNNSPVNLKANGIINQVSSTTWKRVSVKTIVDENGILSVGISAPQNNLNNWFTLADVKLNYYGNTLESFLEEINEEAFSLGMSLRGRIPNNMMGAVSDGVPVIDAEGNAITYTLSEAAEQIIEWQKNTELAKSAIEPYGEFLATRSFVQSINDQTTADEQYKNALEEADYTYAAQAMGAVTVENITNAQKLLKSALANYLQNVNGLADGCTELDLTAFVNDADFTDNASTAWKTTATAENFRHMSPNGSVNSGTYSSNFIECYVNTSKTQYNSNKKLVYQALSGMPKGNYVMEGYAFNRREHFGSDDTIEPNPVYLFINGSTAEINSSTFAKGTVTGFTSDGNLEFGLKSGAEFNTDWNGLGAVSLKYLGTEAQNITLNEKDPFELKNDVFANVTLEKEFSDSEWTALCVPFDIDIETTAQYFSKVKVPTSIETTNKSTVLNFEDASSVKAGMPYLVKANTPDLKAIKAEKTVVYASNPYTVIVNNSQICGNYNPTAVNDNLFIFSGDRFSRAENGENNTIEGFNFYVNSNTANDEILLCIDGVVTTIEVANMAESSNYVDVYTLTGLKVKSNVKQAEALDGLKKGIYIINGKKVMK